MGYVFKKMFDEDGNDNDILFFYCYYQFYICFGLSLKFLLQDWSFGGIDRYYISVFFLYSFIQVRKGWNFQKILMVMFIIFLIEYFCRVIGLFIDYKFIVWVVFFLGGYVY